MLEQAVLERGKPEEIVLLADALGEPATVGAGRVGGRIIHVEFIEDAVLSLVVPLVDVAMVGGLAE